MKPPLRFADGRPRIHVWGLAQGFGWSIGPTGRRTPAPTPGAALDDALTKIGARAAVVILEDERERAEEVLHG